MRDRTSEGTTIHHYLRRVWFWDTARTRDILSTVCTIVSRLPRPRIGWEYQEYVRRIAKAELHCAVITWSYELACRRFKNSTGMVFGYTEQYRTGTVP